MRTLAAIALFSGLLGWAGCSDDSRTLADPTKLAPLTDADKAEIKERDSRIETEEKGTPIFAKKKAVAR